MREWFTRWRRHTPQDGRSKTSIHRRRVLLVENEEVDRRRILPVLDALGFTVDIADDIDGGLRQDDQHEYAGAVVDLNFTKANQCEGFALIAKLRERGRRYPIVILTNLGGIEYEIRGSKVGANDYVMKWLPKEVLRDRLNRLMSGNRG